MQSDHTIVLGKKNKNYFALRHFCHLISPYVQMCTTISKKINYVIGVCVKEGLGVSLDRLEQCIFERFWEVDEAVSSI